ncbi:MAG: hypothetical protein ACOC43_03750 [Desulfohalobiaceae bacterium]
MPTLHHALAMPLLALHHPRAHAITRRLIRSHLLTRTSRRLSLALIHHARPHTVARTLALTTPGAKPTLTSRRRPLTVALLLRPCCPGN